MDKQTVKIKINYHEDDIYFGFAVLGMERLKTTGEGWGAWGGLGSMGRAGEHGEGWGA